MADEALTWQLTVPRCRALRSVHFSTSRLLASSSATTSSFHPEQGFETVLMSTVPLSCEHTLEPPCKRLRVSLQKGLSLNGSTAIVSVSARLPLPHLLALRVADAPSVRCTRTADALPSGVAHAPRREPSSKSMLQVRGQPAAKKTRPIRFGPSLASQSSQNQCRCLRSADIPRSVCRRCGGPALLFLDSPLLLSC